MEAKGDNHIGAQQQEEALDGGSINIFYNTIQGKNVMYVNGGAGGVRYNTYNSDPLYYSSL